MRSPEPLQERVSIHSNSVLSSLRKYHQVFANKSGLKAVHNLFTVLLYHHCHLAGGSCRWVESARITANSLDELARRHRFRRPRVCPRFKGF